MTIVGIESKNLPILLDMYMSIAHVVQVRCNYVIREFYKNIVGQDGLYIACMVQVKDGSDKYLKFEEVLPKSQWDNQEQYSVLLAAMKLKIDNYLYNDIIPKTPYVD